ncbi:MAG: hypothetical protein JWM68_1231 [Verrucomicrobiales bacterium]|nr:hypothetical protein [Verrucomicrobiales bacterium]
MKTVLPWILVLMLAGAHFLVFQDSKRKGSEVQELKKQVAELTAVKAEVEELRQSAIKPEEVARLRKDNAEVYQLRNKVSQLQKEVSTGAIQARQVPATANAAEAAYEKTGVLTPGQLQQVIRENQQLRSEAQEFQVLRQRETVNSCINNLRQLDGATDQWAIENKKANGDLVTANDISPYLKKYPQCASGGTYTVGPVGTSPTCTTPGHALPQ